jgi:protein-S-isoprenylcysteine O-methyltransferase Ste14
VHNLRYLSFAMVTGRPEALLLPAFVVLTNMGQLGQMNKDGRARYGDSFVEYASRVPAVVPGLWPAMSKSAASGAAQKKSE